LKFFQRFTFLRGRKKAKEGKRGEGGVVSPFIAGLPIRWGKKKFLPEKEKEEKGLATKPFNKRGEKKGKTIAC